MSDMTIVSTLSPISSMQKIQFDYNEHQRQNAISSPFATISPMSHRQNNGKNYWPEEDTMIK
jgi:hypothetical protein